MARWLINWEILNKINSTNYVFMGISSFEDYFGMVKHMIISQWTLFWKNDDKNSKKLIANILSIITVIAIVGMFFLNDFFLLQITLKYQ